jgi:hypothetical protein
VVSGERPPSSTLGKPGAGGKRNTQNETKSINFVNYLAFFLSLRRRLSLARRPPFPLVTLWNTPLKIPYRISKGNDSVVFIQFIYAENSSFEGRL